MLGGVFGELLKWFNMRHDLHRGLPDWSRSRLYWIVTLLMAVAGGLLVLAYLRSGFTLNALLAVNLGVSAPLVLDKLFSQLPTEPGKSD